MRGRHDARPCPSFSRPCSAITSARNRTRLIRRAAIVSDAAVGAGGRDSISRSAETRGETMLTDFYVAFATVCFTLLGLWIIVIQTRHGEWRHCAIHRRRAYGVALPFSLPGLMSLFSLVDPASTALWRICFAIVAAGGGLAWPWCAVRRQPGSARRPMWPPCSVPPDRAGGGRARHGRRSRGAGAAAAVEAVLLTILVFLGVNVAWLLLFDQAPPPSGLEGRHGPVRDDTRASQRRRCTACPPPGGPSGRKPAPDQPGGFDDRQAASRPDRAPPAWRRAADGRGPSP